MRFENKDAVCKCPLCGYRMQKQYGIACETQRCPQCYALMLEMKSL